MTRAKARRTRSVLVFVLVFALVSTGAALARQAASRAADAPLAIKSQSYFFVGGEYIDTPKGKIFAGQLYVEDYIPRNRTEPYPIVMIHGGGQTGTNFTGTPDGREGWAQFFLRRGYAVYVVDQVARGRAGDFSYYGAYTEPDVERVQERFTSPERFNLWPQAHLHNQWPGTGRPGDPTFDQFLSSQVPSLTAFPKQQELNARAVDMLLDKIGPAIVLTHSQSGAMGWPIADGRPKLTKAVVAVEPSGPPVHDLNQHGPPNWFSDGPFTKPYGITAVRITYDPPVTDPSQLKFQREEKADSPELARCWLQAQPVHKLPLLAKNPILMIQSEASYHASYDYCTDKYLTQAGVPHTFTRLANMGIHGNGHMMMLEKNNLQIAQLIADWLSQHVK